MHVINLKLFLVNLDWLLYVKYLFVFRNGNDTRTTPESVNHLRTVYPTVYFTYIKKTFSFERKKTMIRDSSAITPLTVMLFSQGHIFGYEVTTIHKILLIFCKHNFASWKMKSQLRYFAILSSFYYSKIGYDVIF